MDDLLSEANLTKVAASLGYSLYKYPRAGITCDVVYFAQEGVSEWKVLLIKRKNPPFEGCWALPGGFMNMDETLEDAAKRELFEETGVKLDKKCLTFEFVADTIDRDPRGRTLTAVYSIFDWEVPKIQAADDAVDAQWHDVIDGLVELNLAFDHYDIISRIFYGR